MGWSVHEMECSFIIESYHVCSIINQTPYISYKAFPCYPPPNRASLPLDEFVDLGVDFALHARRNVLVLKNVS